MKMIKVVKVKITLMFIVLVLLLTSFSKVMAEVTEDQWRPATGKTLYQIIYREQGKIYAASALTRADGATGLVVYAEGMSGVYRCIDWKDKEGKSIGFSCDTLVQP